MGRRTRRAATSPERRAQSRLRRSAGPLPRTKRPPVVGQPGERRDQAIDALLGVADRHQADDADEIAHLRRDAEPVAQASPRPRSRSCPVRARRSAVWSDRSDPGQGRDRPRRGRRLREVGAAGVRASSASAIVRSSNASPWRAIWRRQASIEARIVRPGLVVCDHPDGGRDPAARRRSPWTLRIAAWVRLPSTLWVLATAPSTPLAIAEAGRSGWKWKCGPQASST